MASPRGSLRDITWLLHQLSVDREITQAQQEFIDWLDKEVQGRRREALDIRIARRRFNR